MNDMTTTSHSNLSREVMQLTMLIDISLFIITIKLVSRIFAKE